MTSIQLHDYYMAIISGRRRGLVGALVFAALFLVSLVYRLVLLVRRGMHGLLPLQRLPLRVVSIGNITTGGTGKTPTVVKLVLLLGKRAGKTGVVSRGYKGGDEAMMLAAKLPDAVVLSSPDRYAAGIEAASKHACRLVILDDAFHKRHRLARDFDIVTVDALNPFGYGRLLPAGLLREPPAALREADAVLLTNTDLCDDVTRVEKEVKRRTGNARVFRCAYRLVALRKHKDGAKLAASELKGRTVLAFCGLGNPASFAGLANKLGAARVAELSFPDHHAYGKQDLARIKRRATACDLVVTSEKDAVKLSPDAVPGLLVAEVELVVERQKEFEKLVLKALGI